MTVSQRRPYVGEGADGCSRSAQIDREEADTLDALDTRRDELYISAEAWERQAEHLERHPPRRPESERRRRSWAPSWLAPTLTRGLASSTRGTWAGFSSEPVAITRVDPVLVVEVEADTAFEHGRWRHLTRYRRVRWDLCG